jgi:ABC-2 type transport system permease protein
MSTLSYAVSDSATMLRRNLRYALRYPSTLVMALGVPILLLFLFVGVFAGALGSSVGSASHGGRYIDYLVPGLIVMTVGYGSTTTALVLNGDLTGGIIARFRTMAISRSSVLVGHVAGALIRTMLSIALVIVVALLVGFRPAADAAGWLAVAGVVALLTLALSWLAVAVGLQARNPAGTAGFTLVVQTLPFLSSAFVQPESMSAPVRWIAAHEPYTPIINTMRGLLLGTPIGHDGLIAVAWCVGLSLVGFLWARALFKRDPR